MVGLEQLVEEVTAVAVAVSRGEPAPSPDGVRAVTRVLGQIAKAVRAGGRMPAEAGLPDEQPLRPVVDAVRRVLGVLS
jgi:hypothetical protein